MSAATGRKHNVRTMALARQMYAAGDGWGPTEITRYLARNGTEVHVNTVRQWVRPELAERRRQEQRRRHGQRIADREAGVPPDRPGRATPTLDRMVQLREAGVSYRCVAIVLALDLGVSLSTDSVRYHLRVRREPRRAAPT